MTAVHRLTVPDLPNSIGDNDDVFAFARPEWQHRGACVGKVDIMFPGRGDDLGPAMRICQGCPVRLECALFVLTKPACEDYGVWAGMTTKPLRAARRHVAAGDDPAEVYRQVYKPPRELSCRFCNRTFWTSKKSKVGSCPSDICRARARPTQKEQAA